MTEAATQQQTIEQLLQGFKEAADFTAQQEIATILADTLGMQRLEVTFGRGKKNDLREDIAVDADKVAAAFLCKADKESGENRGTFIRMAMNQIVLQRDMGVLCVNDTLPAAIALCAPGTIGQAEVDLTEMLVQAKPKLTQTDYNKAGDMCRSLALNVSDIVTKSYGSTLPKKAGMCTHVMNNLASLMVNGYKPVNA
jgi:hypothetical protein